MKKYLYSNKGKPIKIVGISSSKRSKNECAKQDPISLGLLKKALKYAEKKGAKTSLIDLRNLEINPCNECYSTNPAQCRFNEKNFQCDCYPFKEKHFYYKGKFLPIIKAYDEMTKDEFIETHNEKYLTGKKDDMWIIYKELMEADGIIIANSTQFYSRPTLLQSMISRLCAVDGGVQELWGDGKNLGNSIKHSLKEKTMYKQRLYGKWCAFINSSKEGDMVTPNLMKAFSMMGLKIIPFGSAYHVNWYYDKTHRKDYENASKDEHTESLLKHMGEEMVELIKESKREYGTHSKIV
ncbi:MAG: hypothetical protein PHS81_00285 [Candidatus Nanoarchaeia archaeon]|nr:hypothetical protein [Candidatus Nanoarchaeia archaeon]